MKLFALSTPSLTTLKEDFFLRTCPQDLEPEVGTVDTSAQYTWGNATFHDVISRKVALLIDLIREHPGEIVLWSDLDIVFLGPCAKRITECMEGKDMCFMSELWPPCGRVNAGFIAIRCNDRSLAFFEEVQKGNFEYETMFEQGVMQEILDSGRDLAWGILPGEFWAYSHGHRPSRHTLVLHATCEGVMEKKIEQLAVFEQYVRDLRRFRVLHGILNRLRRNRWLKRHSLDSGPWQRFARAVRYEQPITYIPSAFRPAID